MDFVTVMQAAELLNLSRQRVAKLCLAGRFKGAIKPGHDWLIPVDKKKGVPVVDPPLQEKYRKLY